MSVFSLIKEKTTYKTIIKRYAEVGSPFLVLLSNLKYSVVLTRLMTHDSAFFIKFCIHFLNLLSNPNLFHMHIKNE